MAGANAVAAAAFGDKPLGIRAGYVMFSRGNHVKRENYMPSLRSIVYTGEPCP